LSFLSSGVRLETGEMMEGQEGRMACSAFGTGQFF